MWNQATQFGLGAILYRVCGPASPVEEDDILRRPASRGPVEYGRSLDAMRPGNIQTDSRNMPTVTKAT